LRHYTWAQRAKLVASDGRAGDLFGCSVAMSGDVLVVGAAGSAHGHRGAAYVFTRDIAGLPSSFWWGLMDNACQVLTRGSGHIPYQVPLVFGIVKEFMFAAYIAGA
jgi:hypothetical protein